MLITSLRLPTRRPAQIEIRYGNEDITEVPFEIVSRIKNTFDCCIEQNEVTELTENVSLWNAIKGLKKRGGKGKIRYNSQVGEVFHNDGVKGAFQIVDGANYLCYITENEGQKQEHQLFHTNTKSFVDIQQYLFDYLCNKAISLH